MKMSIRCTQIITNVIKKALKRESHEKDQIEPGMRGLQRLDQEAGGNWQENGAQKLDLVYG